MSSAAPRSFELSGVNLRIVCDGTRRRFSIQKKTSQNAIPVSTHHTEESTRKKKKAPARKESIQPLTENISSENLVPKLVYVITSMMDLREEWELKRSAVIG